MDSKDLFNSIKHGVIVSCQADEGDPFNSPEGVTLFAKAAVLGGAVGIRSQGIKKTKMIIASVNVPVIGLIKSKFDDGFVKITGRIQDVEDLINIKSDIIAIDGTFRIREGLSGPDFIAKVKKDFNCLVMADIATLDEGIACYHAGADCISSTLSGYTPNTLDKPKNIPDYELAANLVKNIPIPIIAEGRINRPDFASKIKESGVWAIVVGTAITRPKTITSWFIDSFRN